VPPRKRVVCFGTQKLVVWSMEGMYITLRPTAISLCCKFNVEDQFIVSKKTTLWQNICVILVQMKLSWFVTLTVKKDLQ